jgi:citrate lyase beta subunit
MRSSKGYANAAAIRNRVGQANRTFTPTPEVLADAGQIVAAAKLAAKRGDAVTSVNGQMIDRPFVPAAERLLRWNSS